MRENEEFCDKEIAPLLLEVGKKCKEQGVPFYSILEYAPDGTIETGWSGSQPSAAMRIAIYAIRAKGNVDALIKALIKDAEKYGHNSLYLKVLGARAVAGQQAQTTKEINEESQQVTR